jgi:hypothetical protein
VLVRKAAWLCCPVARPKQQGPGRWIRRRLPGRDYAPVVATIQSSAVYTKHIYTRPWSCEIGHTAASSLSLCLYELLISTFLTLNKLPTHTTGACICAAGYAGRLKTAARTPAKQQNTIADVREEQEPLLRPHQLASWPAASLMTPLLASSHSAIYSAVGFGMFELFCL